ncbi:TetR/AcrR family transcriptional regulator [Actinoplanes sp. NPDC023936]|uniref:TetR/AcrR family transcriptional regulator n=1 Tax=Actinoplanes sp. NPDC023936 TaxID=3154910 RepID=UPI00340FBA9D
MPVGEKRTRRRGRVLEEAILDAAWAELAERGWSGFTVEGVAARSGAAKSVIYRRWSGRVELAHALLARGGAATPETVESRGDLRADLLAFLRDTVRFLGGPFGDASRGIVMEGDSGHHASVFGGRVLAALVGELVDQARLRGEISGSPSPLALNIGHAVVMWEFTLTHRLPADDDLARLVDEVWLPAIRSAPA